MGRLTTRVPLPDDETTKTGQEAPRTLLTSTLPGQRVPLREKAWAVSSQSTSRGHLLTVPPFSISKSRDPCKFEGRQWVRSMFRLDGRLLLLMIVSKSPPPFLPVSLRVPYVIVSTGRCLTYEDGRGGTLAKNFFCDQIHYSPANPSVSGVLVCSPLILLWAATAEGGPLLLPTQLQGAGYEHFNNKCMNTRTQLFSMLSTPYQWSSYAERFPLEVNLAVKKAKIVSSEL